MTQEVVNPNSRVFNSEDISRIKEIVREGCQILQETEDLKGGLRDTVKAISEELEIKPAQLNKVIKIAHKNNFTEEQERFDEISDILGAAGII